MGAFHIRRLGSLFVPLGLNLPVFLLLGLGDRVTLDFLDPAAAAERQRRHHVGAHRDVVQLVHPFQGVVLVDALGPRVQLLGTETASGGRHNHRVILVDPETAPAGIVRHLMFTRFARVR